MEPTVRVVLSPDGQEPNYSTSGASGLDLRASHSVTLAPMDRKLVGTGVRMQIPPGYEGQVRPRSGLALKHGLSLVNTPGTVDCDYRGEIQVLMINLGQDVVQLEKGERVAQLVIAPVARAHVQVVRELDDTERGDGGFGSTGTD